MFSKINDSLHSIVITKSPSEQISNQITRQMPHFTCFVQFLPITPHNKVVLLLNMIYLYQTKVISARPHEILISQKQDFSAKDTFFNYALKNLSLQYKNFSAWLAFLAFTKEEKTNHIQIDAIIINLDPIEGLGRVWLHNETCQFYHVFNLWNILELWYYGPNNLKF